MPTFGHRMRVPLLLVGLTFLLRTFSLDWQSLWIDEAHAFYFVNHPFLETVKMIINPENNGPLYFLLLWGWVRLTGASPFAIRYLSDLCSVLTVAVIWQLTRGWFGRRVAGWAGLLWAIAPFAIWLGQEAKMYALHMLLAGLATLWLFRALRANRWYLWLAYGLTINFLGYSHFFGALTIATQGLIVLITTWKSWHKLRSYLVTMVLIALPYLPVVRFVLRQLPNFTLQDISKGFVPLPNMLRELGAEYTLRVSMLQVQHPQRLLWPLALLLGIGIFQAWRRGWREGVWVTGLLVLPTLIFYPISFKAPLFSPKYLSASFPFFIITLALALEALRALWKPLLWLGFAGMIAVAGWANLRILTQPEFQRTDWKTAARFLETHSEPDDVIVVFANYINRVLSFYYKGMLPIYRFGSDPYNPENFYQQELQRKADYHTLWLVLHQDQAMAPHNRMREAAGLLYPQITEAYPNNGQIAIIGYSLRWRHCTLPQSATPLVARFQNGLALVGYHVNPTSLPPTDKLIHPPSNWIHVVTYWQVWDGAPPLDFTPFVRLVDAQGGVWGGELQRPPTVFHRDPPEQWEPGVIVEAHYDVNLNPVTPPGTYQLIVGLERDEEKERILCVDQTREVLLTTINITRR
ncbi:MAG TPA: glycosyltransferase family 39 protein [Anaerolineae bacterium]|nr:glycosyltransferase family 39 protein [Anaerolineae bacterium]HQK14704.1 glycosyltransferase family 39 protein [Anaerolineae bacterium]